MQSERPIFVLFDAVGTIIYPDPDVLSVYHQFGRQHGSQLSIEVISTRFSLLRRKLFQSEMTGDSTQHALSRFEFPSSQQIEQQLWRDLVQQLFTDIADSKSLFEQLWEHFANPGHWRVYEDVSSCWKSLQEQGIGIAIASNFDRRLEPICHELGLNGEKCQLFCSADLGFRKPDLRFYRAIEQSLPFQSLLMVGDDYINDYVAPRLCGWQSLQLVRQKKRRTTDSIDSLSELIEQL